MIAVLGVVFVMATGLSASPADTIATRDALMAADRAFAAASAARGLEGWMDSYAADAVRVRLGGTAVQGLRAIREVDAGLFADPGLRLVWEPTDAGLFGDGRHGFTTGTSAFVRTGGDAAGDTLSTGRYVTFWRLNDDHVWQVILDTGVTDSRASE